MRVDQTPNHLLAERGTPAPPGTQRAARDLTIQDLANILRRRLPILAGSLLVGVALAGTYCLLATRRYQATATLQVLQGSADSLDLQNYVDGHSSTADALQANIDLQTQANILQSDTLVIQTIRSLRLDSTPEFQSRLATLWPPSAQPRRSDSFENSPHSLRTILDAFHRHLSVRSIGGTRLIEVSYQSPDPKRAADVVNALIASLIDYTFQTRNTATGQTSDWLKTQIADLRKRTEDQQSRVVELQRKAGVYSLGTTDAQGREQTYSGVLDELQQQATLLRQAEQNRILKQAISHAADEQNGELVSGLAGSGGAQSMSNSMSVIQGLREREAMLNATLKEAEAKFGSAYPKIAEQRAELEGLRSAIHDEADRIRIRAANDYNVALQQESATRQQFDKIKQQASLMNDKAIEFAIAKQEADQSQELYEDLLKRLNGASALQGLRSSNIVVVDPGRVPDAPRTPNTTLVMLLGSVAGLGFGILCALLLDVFDNRLKSVSEIGQISGLTCLGTVPPRRGSLSEDEGLLPGLTLIGKGSPLVQQSTAYMPHIQSALLEGFGADSRIIVVTSADAQQDQHLISMAISRQLASFGTRVLLFGVDVDAERSVPVLHLGGTASPTADHNDPVNPDIVLLRDAPGVSFAVRKPPKDMVENGTYSLAFRDQLFRWGQQYDYVVLNAPPVLRDSGTLALHRVSDSTVLVTEVGRTTRQELERAVDLLKRHRPSGDLFTLIRGARSYDVFASPVFAEAPFASRMA